MPTTSTEITLSDKPCLHNQPAYGQMQANSYICPVGPLAGRAWVLMLKKTWDTISANASHTLTFKGSRATAAIAPLYLVQGRKLSTSGLADPDAVYLLELADKRLLLERFTDTGAEGYYLRSFANEQPYLTGTFVATWAALLSDLWGNVSTLAGAWPGLPDGYTPSGNPEGFQFHGVNAWVAIHEVLAAIGCTTAYNPLTDSFSVVRIGASQTIVGLPPHVYDAEPENGTATDVPATVRVYFPDHYRSYGQERDTELSTNWLVKPPHTSSDQATGVTGAVAGTVDPVWTNLPRVLDEDGSDDNAAQRATWAAEVKTNYLLDAQTLRQHRMYEGITTAALPGSQVKAVLWRHYGAHAGGTVTEVFQQPGIPATVTNRGSGPFCCMKGLFENISPPDISRHTFPNYPRIANVVRVYDSGEAYGAEIDANADGLHPATIQRWVAGSMATLDPCWLRFVDAHESLAGQVDAINGQLYGPARLSGMETSGGDQRAIYLARRGEEKRSAFLSDVPPLWHGYNSSYQTVTAASTPDVLLIDLEAKNRGGIFSLSTSGATEGELTINASGEFMMSHTLHIDFSSPPTAPDVVGAVADIQRWTGVLWEYILNSQAKANVTADGLRATGSRTVPVTVTKGDKFRIQISHGTEGTDLRCIAAIGPAASGSNADGCSWVIWPV